MLILREARGTLQKQRLYIWYTLIKAAVDGVYVHEFLSYNCSWSLRLKELVHALGFLKFQ